MVTLAEIERGCGHIPENGLHCIIANSQNHQPHCFVLPPEESLSDCVLAGCEERLVQMPNGEIRTAAICPCDDNGMCCLCERGLKLAEESVQII